MLHTLATKLSHIILKGEKLDPEDFEIYVFGWEMILSTGSSLLTILVASIILNRFVESVFFLVAFMVLRSYAGGYHADSYLKCYIATVGVYFTTLILILNFGAIVSFGFPLLLLASIIIVFTKAPIDHPNRPSTKDEKIKFKKISRILVCGFVLLSMLIRVIFPPFALWTSMGLMCAGLLMLVESPAVKNDEK